MEYKDDKRLVEDLCDIEEGLSNWEVNFVESVASQVIDDGKMLSDKQREIANKIIRKRA